MNYNRIRINSKRLKYFRGNVVRGEMCGWEKKVEVYWSAGMDFAVSGYYFNLSAHNMDWRQIVE